MRQVNNTFIYAISICMFVFVSLRCRDMMVQGKSHSICAVKAVLRGRKQSPVSLVPCVQDMSSFSFFPALGPLCSDGLYYMMVAFSARLSVRLCVVFACRLAGVMHMRDGPRRGGRVRVSTHVPWVGMEGAVSGRIQVAA